MNCIKCEHKMEQADKFTLWCPQCGSICSEQHDLLEHWQHPKNLGEGEAGTGYALLSDVDSVVNFTFSLIKHLSEHDPYPNKEVHTADYNGEYGHHVRNVMLKEIAEYLDNWRDK